MKKLFSSPGGFLMIAVASLAFSGCKPGKPPVMFKVDAVHSGIFHTNPVTTPGKIKWKFKTGTYVFSSPAVYENFVYIGSNDSCLYALDKKTGELRWKFRTGGPVASSPAVVGNSVFAISFDGKLYALDTRTGEERWAFNGGADQYFSAPGIHGLQPHDRVMTDTWDIYLSSPVPAGGKIFFGSGNGNFYCVSQTDGKEIWRFPTGGVIHDSPAVSGNKVIFGGWDTFLHALDVTTGMELWKFKTGTDTAYHNQTGIQSSPVISGGKVYFGCRDAHVYVLNLETGALVWKKFNNFSWVNNTPVVFEGVVYYGTSDTHQLIGLDAATGDSLMTIDLNSFIFSSPVIAGDRLYIGDFSGTLHCIDLKNKSIAWQFRTDGSRENRYGILTGNGKLNAGKLGAFFSAGPTYENNLKLMDALYSLGAVLSTPSIDEGMICFGSTDGYVYALE